MPIVHVPRQLLSAHELDEPSDAIYEFLRNNPSEAVFMRLKHEHDGKKANIKDFQAFVEKNYLDGHPEWFLHDNVTLEGLRMKDVRGRIVLLWEHGAKTSNWGYDYKRIDTRSNWKYDSVGDMFAVFKTRAHKAMTASGWFENPTSGLTSTIPHPKKDAERMNPKVLGFLNSNPKTKGIISMDIPQDDMIKKLLELNGPFYEANEV